MTTTRKVILRRDSPIYNLMGCESLSLGTYGVRRIRKVFGKNSRLTLDAGESAATERHIWLAAAALFFRERGEETLLKCVLPAIWHSRCGQKKREGDGGRCQKQTWRRNAIIDIWFRKSLLPQIAFRLRRRKWFSGFVDLKKANILGAFL